MKAIVTVLGKDTVGIIAAVCIGWPKRYIPKRVLQI